MMCCKPPTSRVACSCTACIAAHTAAARAALAALPGLLSPCLPAVLTLLGTAHLHLCTGGGTLRSPIHAAHYPCPLNLLHQASNPAFSPPRCTQCPCSQAATKQFLPKPSTPSLQVCSTQPAGVLAQTSPLPRYVLRSPAGSICSTLAALAAHATTKAAGALACTDVAVSLHSCQHQNVTQIAAFKCFAGPGG